MSKGFDSLVWWNSLRHAGLVLDRKRLAELYPAIPAYLPGSLPRRLRQTLELGHSRTKGSSLDVIDFVLSEVCGFREGWKRGPQVEASWTRRDREGNALRPERLWTGPHGSVLPVFIDKESKTLGLGKGRRVVSRVLRWMRSGSEKLAVLTNGRQWRFLHAGLDYDAWCESDSDLWFEDGAPSPQLHALVSLLSPRVWTPLKEGAKTPLLNAVEESRKGQADLSASLGERVRVAVEKLIDAHQLAIDQHGADIPPCRTLPRRCAYRDASGGRAVCRGARACSRWTMRFITPAMACGACRGIWTSSRARQRVLRESRVRLAALAGVVPSGARRLRPSGSCRCAATAGSCSSRVHLDSTDGLWRAVVDVRERLLRERCPWRPRYGCQFDIWSTSPAPRERIRSGRGTMKVPVPVDFSDLSSEYIGILYEGLLDYELKTGRRRAIP